MSNLSKEQTEEHIKETAKNIFFVQGRFNATTQQIAEEAGVNRTLINYYFRSRNKLIEIIFEEAVSLERNKSQSLLNKGLSFKENIAHFIEANLESNLKYPYLQTFIVSQLNKKEFTFKKRAYDQKIADYFYKIYEAEIKAGNIENIEANQFLFNLISLLSFPNAVRPLLRTNMGISEKEYDRLISERKEIILNLLFKK